MTVAAASFTRSRRPPPSPVPQVNVDRVALERALCKQSFYDFFLRSWHTYCNEDLKENFHHKLFCDEAQKIMERVIRRESKLYDEVINVCPSSTKSSVFSIALQAWGWANDPTLRFICGSYAFDLALYLGSQTRRLVLSDWYRKLFPEVILTGDNKGMLETSVGGQRIAASVESRIQGLHAHAIIVDDPLDPRAAVSDADVDATNAWYDRTLTGRMVEKKMTPIMVVMQRLAQNDLSGHILDRKHGTPVRHVCLPCDLSWPVVRPRSWRKYYKKDLDAKGEPSPGQMMFDPIRLSEEILRATRQDMLEFGYAGQYGQQPVPLGGGMFKIAQFKTARIAPKMARMVRYWDKAGSKGKGSSWTVGCLMGIDAEGGPWVLDVIRGQWEASEREKLIKATARRDGKKTMVVVEQEPGSGGKESAQGTIRRLRGFRVRADRVQGDKTSRADEFAVQVNAGNVTLKIAEWNQPFIREHQFFPASSLKDQVDAAAGAFAGLNGKRYRIGGF